MAWSERSVGIDTGQPGQRPGSEAVIRVAARPEVFRRLPADLAAILFPYRSAAVQP
jgi:hypothetical protein